MAQRRAEEWDAHYAREGRFRPPGPAGRRLLAEHVPAPADGRCLDVGCGLGELARHRGPLVRIMPGSRALAPPPDPA
ncbi:hypothetical protein ACWC4J_10395 [Streptomyces sp. NPDC001356]